MRKEYDYLLVGSGLFNAVFAYLARQHGKHCLVIDKRPHVGGNVYCEDIEGIHVHRYGPHIFHTSNKKVWDFVNQFVSFNRFTLCPVANYRGRIFNLPFNMNTFYQMWGTITPAEAREKIRQQSESVTSKPHNLEEQAILQVGTDIYQTLIKGYTEKQWGKPCKELPSTIIERLPVRFTYDNNYFKDKYQGIPIEGYNCLISKLFDGIKCKTNCNYFDNKRYFDNLAEKIIYTGPIDEYFCFNLGQLEYRSLSFEDAIINTDNYQGNAMVNYTDELVPYTRIIEHKLFDIDNLSILSKRTTVVTKEYSISYSNCSNPFYPINDSKNNEISKRYKEMAQSLKNTYICGRLGEYKYYDMDDIVESSMNLFSKITKCQQ